MAVAAFAPRQMKLSVLTAALQELTPREQRDADPDLAQVLPAQGIPAQGFGREAFRS